jgi:phosphoribosylformylglycinamidine cyclo-ligase
VAISQEEMFGTFNMGVGMVLVTDAEHSEKILDLLEDAYEIGNNRRF